MTTFLARAEAQIGPLLKLPNNHALVALVVLGVPQHQVTRLKRNPVEAFSSIDTFEGPEFAL
jgi:hypothetical protein